MWYMRDERYTTVHVYLSRVQSSSHGGDSSMKYKGKHVHTVTTRDVGSRHIPVWACPHCGKGAGFYDLGFRLESTDVGRWLLQDCGCMYIESADQARTREEAPL